MNSFGDEASDYSSFYSDDDEGDAFYSASQHVAPTTSATSAATSASSEATFDSFGSIMRESSATRQYQRNVRRAKRSGGRGRGGWSRGPPHAAGGQRRPDGKYDSIFDEFQAEACDGDECVRRPQKGRLGKVFPQRRERSYNMPIELDVRSSQIADPDRPHHRFVDQGDNDMTQTKDYDSIQPFLQLTGGAGRAATFAHIGDGPDGNPWQDSDLRVARRVFEGYHTDDFGNTYARFSSAIPGPTTRRNDFKTDREESNAHLIRLQGGIDYNSPVATRRRKEVRSDVNKRTREATDLELAAFQREEEQFRSAAEVGLHRGNTHTAAFASGNASAIAGTVGEHDATSVGYQNYLRVVPYMPETERQTYGQTRWEGHASDQMGTGGDLLLARLLESQGRYVRGPKVPQKVLAPQAGPGGVYENTPAMQSYAAPDLTQRAMLPPEQGALFGADGTETVQAPSAVPRTFEDPLASRGNDRLGAQAVIHGVDGAAWTPSAAALRDMHQDRQAADRPKAEGHRYQGVDGGAVLGGTGAPRIITGAAERVAVDRPVRASHHHAQVEAGTGTGGLQEGGTYRDASMRALTQQGLEASPVHPYAAGGWQPDGIESQTTWRPMLTEALDPQSATIPAQEPGRGGDGTLIAPNVTPGASSDAALLAAAQNLRMTQAASMPKMAPHGPDGRETVPGADAALQSQYIAGAYEHLRPTQSASYEGQTHWAPAVMQAGSGQPMDSLRAAVPDQTVRSEMGAVPMTSYTHAVAQTIEAPNEMPRAAAYDTADNSDRGLFRTGGQYVSKSQIPVRAGDDVSEKIRQGDVGMMTRQLRAANAGNDNDRGRSRNAEPFTVNARNANRGLDSRSASRMRACTPRISFRSRQGKPKASF